MTTMVKATLLFLLMCSFLSQGSSRGTWEQIGGTIDVASHLNDLKEVKATATTTTATSPSLSTTSWNVDLSEDGRRLAVGGSAGLIEIYDLDVMSTSSSSSPQTEIDVSSWRLAAILPGVKTTGSFSLAPDGRMLAVRTSPVAVRVYQIVDETVVPSIGTPFPNGLSSSMKQIGNEVQCPEDGESVKLIVASSGSYFLAMGCETYFNDRGKVQLFQLTTSFAAAASQTLSYSWKAFLSALKGREPGDRFGSALSIVPAPSSSSNRAFRIAVGSPGFNQGQGMVQVFAASNDQTGWMQMGDDLTGAGIGEHFGSSLDLSSNEQPYMVVGAPDWKPNHSNNLNITDESFGRGIIRLFNWQSRTFGSPPQWTLVGNSLIAGTENGDRFGSTVAISWTGERIVASSPLSSTSSSRVREDDDDDDVQRSNQRGYVGVYERESFNKLGSLINDFLLGQQLMDGWGKSVAINKFASMVVSVSSTGMVRSFVDDSAFCGIPRAAGNGVSSDNDKNLKVDTLLERSTCRDFDVLITDEVACTRQKVFIAGKYPSCVWTDIDLVTTMSPTKAPTLAPSEAPIPTVPPPTMSPPTMAPSTVKPPTTSTPTVNALTMKPTTMKSPPTMKPSIQKGNFPSTSPSGGTFSTSLPPNISSPSTAPRQTTAPTRFVGPSNGIASRKPTPPNNENESDGSDNVGNVVKACRCGSSDQCTDDPMSKNDLMLRVCIFVSSTIPPPLSSDTATTRKAVTLDEFTLVQDGFVLPIIVGGSPVSLETSVQCDTNSQGMSSLLSPPNCIVETNVTTAWSTLFDTGRPPYVDVLGTVFSGTGSSPERKLLLRRQVDIRTVSAAEKDGIRFSTRILLSENNTNTNGETEIQPGPASGNGSEDDDEEVSIVFWIVFIIIIIVLFVIIRMYCYRKAKRSKPSNKTSRPPPPDINAEHVHVS